MSYSLAVQQAVYDKLKGSTGLTSRAVGIFDAVPQGNKFPYVVIGEDVTNDWSDFTQNGWSILITLHTWSRYRGAKETKQIQGLCYDALHRQQLAVSGYKFIDCMFVDDDSFLDSDQLTRHGIQQFRILIHQ